MIDSEKYIFNVLMKPVVQLLCCLRIHPNIVTLSSLLSSVYLIPYHNKGQYMMILYLTIFKWFTDGIDGELARYCKMTSKLGGYLDAASDHLFVMVFVKMILSFFFDDKTSWIIAISVILLSVIHGICNYGLDSMHDHEIIKRKNDTLSDRISAFMVNNISLGYIALLALYYYLLKRRNLIK